ncbi:precorrin-2 dehydrogenase/sirohydrochlorin ferrochelatase family protein [Aedoeadaptatus urinae]|uniref:precorrin-2 dehydrogenase/sirohydrochlorin ferrochelatase family protein n=1 Tax=Aedoeadaptatus urinae TaxID=1871017 RepID=UPI00097D5E18|nr:bifunctional precorrin-2 dehydrogenase/sirohydrochlorin ferrochelatase [Peptoniphilus urinae]
MRYFPLMIDTQDKKVLVVGGGKAAATKIKGLLPSSFSFYCLAPVFDESLTEMAEAHPDRIFLKEKTVDADFRFFAYDFLIVATEDEALNASLVRRAKLSSVPVLSTSDPKASDVHMASVVSRGPLVVSISAENPTISKHVKEDMETFLEKYDEAKLVEMNRIRKILLERKSEHISRIMEDLWHEEKISKAHWEAEHDPEGGNESE